MDKYYKEHTQEFIDSTINCDMSDVYGFFENHLHSKGTILDIGFGSGRDMLYFKSKGYEIYGIDPEENFVKHAKKMGLDNVFALKVEDISFDNKFDGIWACASLLHICSENLKNVFVKCQKALKQNGIIYVSFKYGNFEGKRAGRYYLDLTEETIKNYCKDTKLEIVDIKITDDVRADRHEKWLNVILKKK